MEEAVSRLKHGTLAEKIAVGIDVRQPYLHSAVCLLLIAYGVVLFIADCVYLKPLLFFRFD